MECAGLRTWSVEWRFVFARLVSPVTCGVSQGFSAQFLASNLFEKSTRSFLSLSVLWEFLGLTQLAWSRRHTTWANSIRCEEIRRDGRYTNLEGLRFEAFLVHAGSGELSCKQVWRNSETARKASGFNRVVKTHEDRRVDGWSWACSLHLHFHVRCGQLRWITLEAFLLRFHRTDPRTHSVRAPTCVAMGFRCFVFVGSRAACYNSCTKPCTF